MKQALQDQSVGLSIQVPGYVLPGEGVDSLELAATHPVVFAKSPLRISLAGGGTDCVPYCSQFGGEVIGFSINRYVMVSLYSHEFSRSCIAYCEGYERADTVDMLSNKYLRSALQSMGFVKGFQMASFSDVPSGTGLGGSAAFLNSVLLAGHVQGAIEIKKEQIAEKSSAIEVESLQRPVGKQDHYLTALGGANLLSFDRELNTQVHSITLGPRSRDYIKHRLMLFYTGMRRSAGEALSHQAQSVRRADVQTVDHLHRIRSLVQPMSECLKNDDPEDIGKLINEHWQLKRCLSKSGTSDKFDALIDLAMTKGADGCKILGAGGGGFILVSSKDSRQDELRKAFQGIGLQELTFDCEFEGAKAARVSLHSMV